MFALRWVNPPEEFWLLEQGGKPVGMIRRADGGTRLRTVSEEWSMGVTGRKRLGRQLVFARLGELEPTLRYSPSTLRQGGRLDVSDGRPYKLRAPLLRADWRLVAASGGEVAWIAYRGPHPVQPPRKHIRLSTEAADEPLLPGVILAASAVILVHHELPRGFGGSGI
jgi:hypothetical protein